MKEIAFSKECLANYYELPLKEVAVKFGVCTTTLKKVCRLYGINRWPHRKIKAINKTIEKLEEQQKKDRNTNLNWKSYIFS